MVSAELIRHRESCLIERAYACAAGFDEIGLTDSADLTRGFARQIEGGMPGVLLEHWVDQQEQRLKSKKELAGV